MGMDVVGRALTSEAGKYFSASIWSWPAILALDHVRFASGWRAYDQNCTDSRPRVNPHAACTRFANSISQASRHRWRIASPAGPDERS